MNFLTEDKYIELKKDLEFAFANHYDSTVLAILRELTDYYDTAFFLLSSVLEKGSEHLTIQDYSGVDLDTFTRKMKE